MYRFIHNYKPSKKYASREKIPLSFHILCVLVAIWSSLGGPWIAHFADKKHSPQPTIIDHKDKRAIGAK